MIDKPNISIALLMSPNATIAHRRYDLFDKLLHPDAMDRAEIHLVDSWWIPPDQRNQMGAHKKPS